MLTRFLPFILFNNKTPEIVQYIDKYPPSSIFGMLVIYCLKNVNILQGSPGLPELISIIITASLHIWKRQMLLSIAVGTISYMLLIRFFFSIKLI